MRLGGQEHVLGQEGDDDCGNLPDRCFWDFVDSFKKIPSLIEFHSKEVLENPYLLYLRAKLDVSNEFSWKNILKEWGYIVRHPEGLRRRGTKQRRNYVSRGGGDTDTPAEKEGQKMREKSQSPPTPDEIGPDWSEWSGHPRQEGMTHGQLFHHSHVKYRIHNLRILQMVVTLVIDVSSISGLNKLCEETKVERFPVEMHNAK